MPNRLAEEGSPYLLQHKDDPVEWFPWGEEAFAVARSLDKPVFLSVGYSSCHWCHVMAHESFQDAEVASALNRDFVSIKVDREQRPDVDDAYMTAVQLATGHGGWPMSVFMTPDKRPFFAGTYFPKDARGDFPGFRTLVSSLGQSWRAHRDEIEESATRFAETLTQYLTQSAGPLSPVLDLRLVDKAIEELHEEFDFENGGFGSSPKFPPHSTLRFLTEYAAKRHLLPGVDSALTEQAAHMALMTLERMALGGIHDHVGGGFHRYSTDEVWMLPHFEKMLTDNALLLRAYSVAARSSGDPALAAHFSRVADRIVEWLAGTMRSDSGTFFSAVDADSEGEEGLYYTWAWSEVEATLGDRAETFCNVFGLEVEGNFADEATRQPTGRNILKLDQDIEGSFDEDLGRLAEARSRREHPLIDTKCIAAYNGLAISGLALNGRVELASECAQAWTSLFGSIGHLPRQADRADLGYLEDYAYMANGLLDLFDASHDKQWRGAAERVVDQMCELFQAGDRFTSTSDRHEELFGRTVPALDGATPSALAEAARAVWRIGRHAAARRTLLDCLGWMQRTSRATHSLALLAFEDMVAFPEAERTLAEASRSIVTISLDPAEPTAGRDGWAHADVVFRVPDGMHINSNDPTAKWLTPTALHVEGVLGEAAFPGGETYSGEVRVPLRLRAGTKTQEFLLRVRYQACTESECLLPQEAEIPGRVVVP